MEQQVGTPPNIDSCLEKLEREPPASLWTRTVSELDPTLDRESCIEARISSSLKAPDEPTNLTVHFDKVIRGQRRDGWPGPQQSRARQW